MARGGYIQPKIAMRNLLLVTGSQKKASRIIYDGLIYGLLKSRGRPVLQSERYPHPGIVVPRPDDEGSSLGEMQDIKPGFWLSFNPSELRKLDWQRERYRPEYGDDFGYMAVSFSEKDINALIKTHKPAQNVVQKSQTRMRASSWNDWVAAIAILASEQRITGDMTRADLLGILETKLNAWDLEGKEISTVGPAASAVLKRFRENPPVKPKA